MDRLIAPNSVPLSGADTAPASGTPQYATDGNPAAGLPATQWPAYQYNAIQEELLGILVKAGITPDRTQLNQIATAIPLLCPGRLIGSPIVVESSQHYVPSTEARLVRVRVVGAGGSGGGSTAPGSSNCSACSGGGSGAYVDAWYLVSALGTSVAVTIGAAGTAILGSGGNGGTTIFGSFISCPGGSGGVSQSYASTAISYAGQGLGGAAPTVTGALMIVEARRGSSGANGFAVNGISVPGIGANSPLGSGGPNGANVQPDPATGYGAGGGAPSMSVGASAAPGGLGTAGVVVIEEYT